MADIYLMGHGAWETKGSSDAYTKVPKGTKLIIYTPIGTFINSSQTAAILMGEKDCLPPLHEFTEFKMCPNTTLSHGLFSKEKKALKASGKSYYHPASGVENKLAEILEASAIKGNTVHWMACQPRLGGKDTTEGGFNDDYLLKP
jgi:hypothetical protein